GQDLPLHLEALVNIVFAQTEKENQCGRGRGGARQHSYPAHVALHRWAFWIKEIERQPVRIPRAQGKTDGRNGSGGVLARLGGQVKRLGRVEDAGWHVEAVLQRF